MKKHLPILASLLLVISFLSSGNYAADKSCSQTDSSIKISILTYIYLGETDNDFFITARIDEGEVFPEMLLDAVSKTGKRFSVKVTGIEKTLFSNDFIPSAKTGDSVCIRAQLNSGKAAGFNHQEYVLVNTGAAYFDAVKK